MRKAILTTAAIGLIACGAALGVTQGDTIKSWLTSSAQLYNTAEVADATTPAAADVAQSETAATVTTDAVVADAAQTTAEATTATEPTATDTTTTTEEGASTPVDLDASIPAAGEEVKADTTPVEEKAAEPELAIGAETPDPNASAVAEAETAEPAFKYTFDVEAAAKDREQGSAKAPVVIEDFSSLTCPHCAKFHNEIFDKVKTNYIDTGKVRWIYRSFPLNEAALRAEMLARCAPNDQYIALRDMLFKNQVRWAYTDDPMANLSIIVRVAGINDDIFLACVNNKELQAKLVTHTQELGNRYDVKATPTFVFNGGEKKFSGGGTYEGFAADIEELLRGTKETKQTEVPAGKL